MKCQKNRVCKKQPGDAPPVPADVKRCTGCDCKKKDMEPPMTLATALGQFAAEVDVHLSRGRRKRRYKCVLCKDNGFLFHADPSDKDNGKPCPMCNPAALCRKSWLHGGEELGTISVMSLPVGAIRRLASIRYACGCMAGADSNQQVVLGECPTLCKKHGKPVKMYTETLEME